MNNAIHIKNVHTRITDWFESLEQAVRYYELSMPDRDWTSIETVSDLSEKLPDHLCIAWKNTNLS